MSGGYGPAPGAGAVPPGNWPPPAVVAAANQHQLGGHVASRQPPTPPSGALTRALIGGGLLVLGCVVLGLARAVDPFSSSNLGGDGGSEGLFWVLRVLAGVSCVAAVGFLAQAARAAAASSPAESHYLFEGGIVRYAGGQPTILSWSDVREAQPVIASDGPHEGTITHYSLVRQQGLPFMVPVTGQPGPDPFVDHLVALLRSRDVTIRPARPV